MSETKPLSAAATKVLETRASAMFDAILDYTLGNPKPRTNPQVTSLTITSDGFLMGWNTANPYKEGLMGSASDLDKNVRGICKHCGLTPAETEEIVAAVYAKISDWRPAHLRLGYDPHRPGAVVVGG